MRVAVVGGGAAGLVTAYLLSDTHEVHLFEAAEALGGHVRTLGRNVPCPRLAAGVHVENGVLGFHRRSYVLFHRLMAELGVGLVQHPRASGFFDRTTGEAVVSQVWRHVRGHSLLDAGRNALAMRRILSQERLFVRRTDGRPDRLLHDRELGGYLAELDTSFRRWIRCVTMLFWSTPFRQTSAFPAEIAIPVHRRFAACATWSFVEGGVYRYVERLLARAPQVRTSTGHPVTGVKRDRTGVDVTVAGRGTTRHDAVVLAATPDRVLSVLEDPTEAERRRFGAWRAERATTVAHVDDALHAPFLPGDVRSVGDMFWSGPGRAGYNTTMNGVYGIRGPERYSFAFGLQDDIHPERVLDVQHHATPHYTVEALASREEVRATNGERRTLHAGAWLHDGLHEGALRSAVEVSRRLGGRLL